MKTVQLNGRMVGDDHPCLITFELGATHGGLESAKRLCDVAARAGADAVKLQTVLADECMAPDHDVDIEYVNAEGKHSESIYQALKRRELTFEQWKELKQHCDRLGLLFISTPSGPQTVDWLVEMDAAAIKVSKSDINHRPLIEYICSKDIPIILDAREHFSDVENAVRIAESHGQRNIIIMHCPSGYPAEHAGVNLKTITQIRSVFQYPVAYSDHSVGTAMNFAAIGLGANMLEKTISEDRDTNAVEHYMSLEPNDLKSFVDEVRAVEAAMGDPRIIFSSRVKAEHRRSLVAGTCIPSGEKIQLSQLTFKRPGTKIPVDQVEKIIGRVATRDISPGEYLDFSDVA